MATPSKTQISPHAVIGVVVCLLGVLFTLDNLHLVDASNFFHYWPLVPIGMGLLFLMQANELAEWGRGAVWLAIGIVFMARSMGYLPFSPFALWPLLLVLVGVKMMWGARAMDCEDWRHRKADRHLRREQRQRDRQGRWDARLGHAPADDDAAWGEPSGTTPGSTTGGLHEPVTDPWAPFPTEPTVPPSSPSSTHASFAPGAAFSGVPGAGAPRTEPPPLPDDERARAGDAPYDSGRPRGGWSPGYHANSRATLFALMSGLTRRVQGVFRGGQLTAIMGGIELDLRGAHLEDVAVIDTLAFWGGIEIYVPEDWVVVNQGFALMGGFDDSTKSPLPGERPHLIVKGLALMGGVEIKVKKDSWWKRK